MPNHNYPMFVTITKDWEKMKTKRVHLRCCDGENPPAFEIALPESAQFEYQSVELPLSSLIAAVKKAGYGVTSPDKK